MAADKNKGNAMGYGLKALALVASLVAPFAANATLTYNLSSASDRDAWDSNKDGTIETLQSDSADFLYVAKEAFPSFDGSTSRAAMEFQLASPLPRPRIISATLYLRVDGASSLATELDKFQIQAHSYAGDGSVTLADFSVNDPFLSPDYWNAFLIPANLQWIYNFALDVKPALLALNPSENYLGLMLEGLTPSGGFSFRSSDNSNGFGPLLRILVAVPEPGTLALLGLGLLGIGLSRRKA